MIIEEPTDKIYRNLDSVKCKVRDEITDEIYTVSYSELSDYDRARALENVPTEDLLKVIDELNNSFMVDMFILSATLRRNTDFSRMELVNVINVLADHIREFGEQVQLELPPDFNFDMSEDEEGVQEDATKDA